MSTQRRAASWQCSTSAEHAGASEINLSAPLASLFRAAVISLTAPPHFAARLATNSLSIDSRFVTLVGWDVGRGSPPTRAAGRAYNSPAPGNGPFLSLIPLPTGFLRSF